MRKSSAVPVFMGSVILLVVITILIFPVTEVGEIQKNHTCCEGDFDKNNHPSDVQKNIRDFSNDTKNAIRALTDHQKITLFLGDSITSGGNWAPVYPDTRIRNAGLPGDKTSDILKRFPTVTAEKPHQVFLMVGINDMINYQNNSAIEQSYHTILQRFSTRLPQSRIYVQSVLPVNHKRMKTSFNSSYDYVNNSQIAALNHNLSIMVKQYHNTEYINIYPDFINQSSNELDENFTIDGIHLNSRGYNTWKTAIVKFISSQY
jgi:lysophospholipase L1-like esterase